MIEKYDAVFSITQIRTYKYGTSFKLLLFTLSWHASLKFCKFMKYVGTRSLLFNGYRRFTRNVMIISLSFWFLLQIHLKIVYICILQQSAYFRRTYPEYSLLLSLFPHIRTRPDYYHMTWKWTHTTASLTSSNIQYFNVNDWRIWWPSAVLEYSDWHY